MRIYHVELNLYNLKLNTHLNCSCFRLYKKTTLPHMKIDPQHFSFLFWGSFFFIVLMKINLLEWENYGDRKSSREVIHNDPRFFFLLRLIRRERINQKKIIKLKEYRIHTYNKHITRISYCLILLFKNSFEA